MVGGIYLCAQRSSGKGFARNERRKTSAPNSAEISAKNANEIVETMV